MIPLFPRKKTNNTIIPLQEISAILSLIILYILCYSSSSPKYENAHFEMPIFVLYYSFRGLQLLSNCIIRSAKDLFKKIFNVKAT